MLKPTIICVDDEQLILIAIKEQLQINLNNEFYIETAESGEEALEIIEELRNESSDIPVIISDYLMPSMKGDKFLIKAHEIIPETRKILLTGQARIEGVTNAVNNADLYRFIEKPWNQDDLILTVKEAVKSYFQSKKIFEYNKQLEEMNADLEDKVRIRTKELREANATKDKFLSIIAHDLKNPFTTLLGFSDMLIKDYDSFDEDEKITFITEINNSAKHAYKLLENLLQWSRAHTGRIQNEPQALVVQDLIWEVASTLKDDFAHKKIRFFVDAERHIKVFADKNMTISVIGNLLSNSIKFSQERAKVSITATEKDDGKVYVSVIDEGIGISEEDQNKLFRIDVHYVSIGPAKEKGTGLGLILCKEFLKRIGGDIYVKSEFGKGSEFTVTLPKCNS